MALPTLGGKPVKPARCLSVLGLLLVLAVAPALAGAPGPSIRLESLGAPSDCREAAGRKINEMVFHEGCLYLGTGDAVVNTGPTPVIVWDPAKGAFHRERRVDDEAILRFRTLDGKLAIPGCDATESWELGNVYVREGDAWTKHRTLPHAIHVLDVTSYQGAWFAATGNYVEPVEGRGKLPNGAVLASMDQGKTWQYVYMTPMDLSAVWRVGSLVVYRGRLYAFPYCYAGTPVARIPEELRPHAGPAQTQNGVTFHTLYRPDPSGPAEAVVTDGSSWAPADLLPIANVCRVKPFVFRDRLLMQVISGDFVAAFSKKVYETRRAPKGMTSSLWAFDGETTKRVNLDCGMVRDVLVRDGRLAVLGLRDERYMIFETEDLESWTAHHLPLLQGHALSIERDDEAWYVGTRDGNVFRAPHGATASHRGPESFRIVTGLPEDGFAYWGAITRLAEGRELARATFVRGADGTVSVETGNVAELRVFADGIAAKEGDTVVVTIDGHEAFRGDLEGDGSIVCRKDEKGAWHGGPDTTTRQEFVPRPDVLGVAAVDLTRDGVDPTIGLWVADAMRQAAKADLAILNRGCVRRDLAAGPLHPRDIEDVVYRNKLAVVELPGAALLEMLAHNLAVGGRDRCQFSGLTATWAPGEGLRACSLEPERTYRVVFPDWTAKNAEKLFGRKLTFETMDLVIQDALLAWLREHERIEPIEPRLTVVSGR
jgi:hypothetical protein